MQSIIATFFSCLFLETGYNAVCVIIIQFSEATLLSVYSLYMTEAVDLDQLYVVMTQHVDR